MNGGAGYDGMFLRGNYTIDFNAPGYTGLFTNIENLTLTSATDERYARGGGTEFDYNLTLSDGNGGADVFRYQGVGESTSASMDHILDFEAGVDKVDLSRMDADTLTAGNQAFAWIGSNAFSGTAGQLRAYEDGGSWFVEGDTNGDGAADLVIKLTVTGGALTQGDFLP